MELNLFRAKYNMLFLSKLSKMFSHWDMLILSTMGMSRFLLWIRDFNPTSLIKKASEMEQTFIHSIPFFLLLLSHTFLCPFFLYDFLHECWFLSAGFLGNRVYCDCSSAAWWSDSTDPKSHPGPSDFCYSGAPSPECSGGNTQGPKFVYVMYLMDLGIASKL